MDDITYTEKLQKARDLINENIIFQNKLLQDAQSCMARLKKAKAEINDKLKR